MRPSRLLLLLATPARGAAQAGQFATADTWSYGAQESWSGVSGACVGESQSPVDINTSRLMKGGSDELRQFSRGTKLGPLVWSFLNSTVASTLSNEHSTWVAEFHVPFCNTTKSMYYGYEFQLKSVSFHSPSENTIDGLHYDMEAQLLHTHTGRGGKTHYMVTSVMLRVADADVGRDASNRFLQHFWGEFPSDGARRYAQVGNPYRFLYPRDRSYYAFNGSLTSPPCAPAIWVVFATPVRIGAGQLQAFRRGLNASRPSRLRYPGSAPRGVSCPSGCPALSYRWALDLGENARLPQPLAGRWVKRVSMRPTPRPEAAASGRDPRPWLLAAAGVLALAALCVCLAMRDARDPGSESEDARELWEGAGPGPLAPLRPGQGAH